MLLEYSYGCFFQREIFPMNLAELEKKLANSKVSQNDYSLTGGLPSEAYCIEHGLDGKWYVYYSERGQRSGLEEFESENEACDLFFSWIGDDTDLGPLIR